MEVSRASLSRVDEIIVGRRHRTRAWRHRRPGTGHRRARALCIRSSLPRRAADRRERRLEAFSFWGGRIPATVVDLEEIVRGELAETSIAKTFCHRDRADRRALEPDEKAAAKERETLGKLCLGSEDGQDSRQVPPSPACRVKPSERSRPSSRPPRPSRKSTPSSPQTWTAPGASTGRSSALGWPARPRLSAGSRRLYPNRGPYRVISADPRLGPMSYDKQDPSHQGHASLSRRCRSSRFAPKGREG